MAVSLVSAEADGDGDGVAADPPVWEVLPAGEAADGHALIVTAAGTYTPSGKELTGPVDSLEKLDKLIRWASLTPLGAPAQIWVVGLAACELLGWVIDPGSEDDVDDMEALRTRAATELTAVLHATLPPLLGAGWELRGEPGHVVHLSRTIGNFTSMVDVVIEPYVWTYWNKDFGWHNRVGDMGVLGSPTAGTYLPDDDLPAARELGRRLAWCAQHLGVLPGPTPARTGAAIIDKIKRERTRSGKGIVVTTAGPVPPLDGAPRGDLEPAVGWTRIPEASDLEDADRLVSIDQRAAYLASAGMLELGYGQPTHLTGGAAAAAAVGEKSTPFGLWRITLPAGQTLSLPEKLPLPHPHMLADQPVQTWVTTVTLDALREPVAVGGIGADLDDLDITEAWVYPQQGRVLDKWAKILREARKTAVDTQDAAMKGFLGSCYKGYIGRMVNPDMWTATRMQHHHQPLWRASIIAHCRWRGRRVAMRIARQHHRWPIRTVTDSWVYLLPEGEDIANPSEVLGKMTVEKDVALTDTLLASVASAADVHEVNLAIKAAFTDHEDTDGEGVGGLMALHLPKPRTRKPAQQAVGLDGLKVSVANAATSGVEKSKQVTTGGLAGLTSKVSVKQLRTELGNEGLRQAAIDAGRTPPSDRTLRRWAQQGRIPHADVLERAQRRAAIERLGGIDAVAAKIGRSRSAVSRYRSGETNELRADASKKLKTVRAEDIMARAGVLRPDGTPKTAVIRVKGGVMVRNGADEGYDYRVRTLDFANSDTPFSPEESRELAAALANDDHARVVALLERHATLDYPENKGFDRYSDQFGFHFDHIDSVHIDWI